jgi:hypothetical protein
MKPEITEESSKNETTHLSVLVKIECTAFSNYLRVKILLTWQHEEVDSGGYNPYYAGCSNLPGNTQQVTN